MSFNREALPCWEAYAHRESLKLLGRGSWRTTECRFHGGSDSLRVNLKSGGWVCMACGVHGGDTLSYHMQAYALEFMDAAKQLGAWVNDGKNVSIKALPISPRDAIAVLHMETLIISTAAANIANGFVLQPADLKRVLLAANRVIRIQEIFR